MLRLVAKAAGLAVLLLGLGAGALKAQDGPKRSIVHVAGDLYRFQNNFHFSVFLVTGEGVIVADPINADTAKWLKAEIRSRFNQPVRYVIYSHDHADHISGGEVFADSAIFVAQDKAKAKIAAAGRTATPAITFRDFMTIELGGKRVELIFPGPSHSDNLIVMRFPDERALFVVDVASVKRLPYRTLGDYHFPEAITALERIETIDFDILVPGHGPMGTRQDVSDHKGYLEDAYAAVREAKASGMSLRQAQASIKLEKYKDWTQYDAWRNENIEGLWRHDRSR
ncbi:MAG: MBL fold metallo-hydrolase [Sphingomonadales bacterium]